MVPKDSPVFRSLAWSNTVSIISSYSTNVWSLASLFSSLHVSTIISYDTILLATVFSSSRFPSDRLPDT